MQKNISYINSWNYFSKSLFLKKSPHLASPSGERNLLVITETNKDIEHYSKIMDFLKINFRIIDNYAILNDFINPLIPLSGEIEQIIYLASIETLENISLNKNQFEYFSINFEKNKDYNLEEISKKLIDLWYNFSEYENSGTFQKKWDILKIISPDSKIKYEISFWWDTIEEIRVTTLLTPLSGGKIVKNIIIWKNNLIEEQENKNLNNFLEIIKDKNLENFFLDNLNFSKYYDILTEKLENFSCFDYIKNDKLKAVDLEISVPKIENTLELKKILEKNKYIEFFSKTPNTIKNFLEYNNIGNFKINETKLNNLKSYTHPQPLPSKEGRKIVICDDILSKIFTRKRVKKNLSADLDLLLKIKPGDYVVHIEHWIWIFKDIIKKENPLTPLSGGIWKVFKEYILIEYAWEDKLFVPITEVSRVNKYLWTENPKLTGLWGNVWENKLNKAKQEASEIARELINIYAQRKLQKWFSFVADTKKENYFKNSFSYVHTIDQSQAIEDILSDMQEEKPMDRLLVWDVGFGKTEIAFNAIYRSFFNKKQSILIVPLVVLAYEHFEKAKERFKEFWLKIWILTRLETAKNIDKTLRELSTWKLDLVIWTHKVLSDKIVYKDLWLIVTDEEHKFWVADKEKIKEFKTSIDSLAMSATPIPRSLNMALSNIRQISILKTPPTGRQNIDTLINRFSDNIIEMAWNQEFNRSWQMFFVHNRVSSIDAIAKVLQNIFPEKKIIITHGQLPGIELEKRIIAFKNKKADILLSTTVIENWIDFSNVNTIIINNAEQFWLSQIHQLRWRVWRNDKKAYCYLLYKWENIKPDTAKRLKMLAEYSYVWAGFELAMKDLEIRWGWDLLWFKQSWTSSSIWINLYLKIIEEEILKLQENIGHPQGVPLHWNCRDTPCEYPKINIKIDLDISIFIEDSLFWSELDKINFYREIELINDLEELEDIKKDFIENNNLEKNIEWLENLFDLIELKIRAKKYFITNIKKNWINYQIDFYDFKDKDKNLKNLRKILDLDKQVKFAVKDLTTLRTSAKSFANTEKFLKYMLSLFKGHNLNTKIKKIWKK